MGVSPPPWPSSRAPALHFSLTHVRATFVRFVFATFFEAVMTVLYTYAIFARYCMPYFQEMDGDYKSLVLGIFKVMMPGTVRAIALCLAECALWPTPAFCSSPQATVRPWR